MRKALILDMDGTIVDFYRNGWKIFIGMESTIPYRYANPMYDMPELNAILNEYRLAGWNIVIVTWMPKRANIEYQCRVKLQKMKWLQRYQVPYDNIYMVEYGADKKEVVQGLHDIQILVDDCDSILNEWKYRIDAKDDIIEPLKKILKNFRIPIDGVPE